MEFINDFIDKARPIETITVCIKFNNKEYDICDTVVEFDGKTVIDKNFIIEELCEILEHISHEMKENMINN